MHETSGTLRLAIETYLRGEPMTLEHIAAMRAYLRQWMATGDWRGPEIAGLTLGVDGLVSREAISLWLNAAVKAGTDPL
jgi:hypothetical protein